MRLLLSISALGLAAHAAFSQTGGASSSGALSLDDAIALARRNNPGYLTQVNVRRTADAQMRATYGALLPRANAGFNSAYQQGGTQYFQGIPLSQVSGALTSSYSLGLSYSINVGALVAPRLQHANREASEADISSNAETLRAAVTQAYLNALQSEALASLQDTLVLAAQLQLDLQKARIAVGSASNLDVKRAEVALSTAQINALKARSDAEISKVTLFQSIGADEPPNVQLTTRFAVGTPTFTLDSVLTVARAVNPALGAARARQRSAGLQIRATQGQYTPTLSLNTGWGGTSFQYSNPDFLITEGNAQAAASQGQCLQVDSLRTRVGLTASPCGAASLTAAQQQAIRDGNNNFPFKFQRTPLGLSAGLSIPLFDGFSRENNLEQAIVGRDNAQLAVRTQDLQVTASVTQDFMQLTVAAKTIGLQEQTAAEAREELDFAEEKYRVGQATYLDVITARSTYEQALINRLNSIYDYHKAFAALESAVGRPLR
jgi:outer membrane protein